MPSFFKKLFKSKESKISDFSSIGFPVNSVDDLLQWGYKTNLAGSEIKVPAKGAYYQWTLQSGAELWAQVDSNGQGMGLHPSFSGKSKVRVKAVPTIAHKGTVLDGVYRCWLITDDQEYPFVFEAPNFFQHASSEKEVELIVQVTAFAKELKYFPNKKAFDDDTEWKLADRSFIPSDVLKDSTYNQDPQPHAAFNGYIKAVELKTNEETGNKFYWFLVDTLSAEYDVVADPRLLKIVPEVGGLLGGSYYLSGKIIES